jgi:glycosyltransferase involved in cell wall biosynthesis
VIAGITKVRNEAAIIVNTITHFSQWCDRIYIYDDASTDATPDICETFHNVVLRRGSEWSTDRWNSERDHRQIALEMAQADSPDWIMQFDADERFELPATGWSEYDAVRMKLFDFYITAEDVHLPYTERRWMGPEFRSIIMMYRNHHDIRFTVPDQREMRLPPEFRVLNGGYVKHYGKAISIEEWEATCRYYSTYFPEPYRTKWLNRKGKAIHTESDFGRPLITWDQKDSLGVPM